MNQTYKKSKMCFGKRIVLDIRTAAIACLLLCTLVIAGCSRQNEWGKSKGVLYYYDENGEIVTDCILEIEDARYHFDENGIYTIGWYQEGADWYYFDTEGKMVCNQEYTVEDAHYFFTADGKRFSGWQETENGLRYFGEDGKMALKGVLIGEEYYYFNEDGSMLTGWSTDNKRNIIYYCSDGKKAVSRKVEIDGSQYYFDEDGYVVTGLHQEDEDWFYYDEDGRMYTDGWLTIDGEKYYFHSDGRMQRGILHLESGTYYFDMEGVQQFNQTVDVEGYRYLITEEGTCYTGWLEQGGKKYYYQAYGKQSFGSSCIDGNWYYFNADGSMHTGWLNIGGASFYYGSNGIRYEGERVVYGVTYMFTEDGSYILQNSPGNAAFGQSGNFTAGQTEYVVVLDAGHGGVWPGAIYSDRKEKDLTLQVALYCKAELETYKGVTVYLTRSSDIELDINQKLDLEERADYAQSVDADLLVSLHFNSSVNHTVNGVSVYISMKNNVASKSQKLANSILTQLGGLGLRNMGYLTAVSDQYVSADGTAADYYAINRHCADRGFPGIIVEHCFMDNAVDQPFISSSAALQQLGVADATGIASYLGLKKK